MSTDSETPSLSLDAWHNLLGLPEGCELRRLRDVPKDWEWQQFDGHWSRRSHSMLISSSDEPYTGLVVCRPVAPATERVPWAKTPGRKLTDGREVQHVLVSRAGWVWLCHEGDARTRVHDLDALVEVLVEDSP